MSPKRKIPVSEYDRFHYGKLEHIEATTRDIKVNEAYLKQLELDKASKININRLVKTHPDYLQKARLTFLIPNEYWRKHPDRCDVLGLDCKDAPEWRGKDKPELGIPGQVVKYKKELYVANREGKFSAVQRKITEYGSEQTIELGASHTLTEKNLQTYFEKYGRAKMNNLEKYFSGSSKQNIQESLDKLHKEKQIYKDKWGWYRSRGHKSSTKKTKSPQTLKEMYSNKPADTMIVVMSPEGIPYSYQPSTNTLHKRIRPGVISSRGVPPEKMMEGGSILVQVHKIKPITPKGTSGGINYPGEMIKSQRLRLTLASK